MQVILSFQMIVHPSHALLIKNARRLSEIQGERKSKVAGSR